MFLKYNVQKKINLKKFDTVKKKKNNNNIYYKKLSYYLAEN